MEASLLIFNRLILYLVPVPDVILLQLYSSYNGRSFEISHYFQWLCRVQWYFFNINSHIHFNTVLQQYHFSLRESVVCLMKKSIIWQMISTQSRGSLKEQSSFTTHISSFLICPNSVSRIELYSWIASKILVLATPHIVVCYLLSPRSRIYSVYSEQLLCICKSQSGVGVQIGNDSMSSLNPAEPVIDDRHKLFSKEFIYY